MIKRKIKDLNIHGSKNLNSFLRSKIPYINFVYAAFILNLFNLTIVLVMQKNLPPQVPLFYGFTESEQQLTTSLGLIIPGIYSLSLVLLNTILTILIKNDFLKKTLSTASFTISLLSLVTVLKIVFLVGFF